jgi:mannose-1-phosphate guanylyltransferase
VLDGCVVGDGARIGADNEIGRGSRVWLDVTLVDKAIRLSSDQS